MADDLVLLAERLAGADRPSIIRLGTVTAVNAGPPVLVTIDDRQMRCLATYTSPQVGHVVVWLEDQSVRIALGPRL